MNRRSTIKTLALSIAVSMRDAKSGPPVREAVRLLVPFPPGGATDALGRELSLRLGRTLGQEVVVLNRPGAGTLLAAQEVARTGDAQVAMIASNSTVATSPMIYKDIPYDSIRIRVLVRLGFVRLFLAVPSNSRASDLDSLMMQLSRSTGPLTFASPGSGTLNHILAEGLCRAAGCRALHVPYRGTVQALIDVVSGKGIDFMFSDLTAAQPFLSAGKLRVVAATGSTRSTSLPMTPAIGEVIPSLSLQPWHGVAISSGSKGSFANDLVKALRIVASDPEFDKRLVEIGISPSFLDGSELETFVREYKDTSDKLIAELGIQLN